MVRFMVSRIPYMVRFMVIEMPYMVRFMVSKIPSMFRFMARMTNHGHDLKDEQRHNNNT